MRMLPYSTICHPITCSPIISVTVISIVRLATIVSVDLKSPDLDYNFAYVGIWTATESNIAIVSGTTMKCYLHTMLELSHNAACLPSLRPVLSFFLYGDPNPSSATSNTSGRTWVGYQSSAPTQGDHESRSKTKSRHKFVNLPDETSQATAIAGRRDVDRHEDIEMQPSYDLTSSEINVRSDVNVEWA